MRPERATEHSRMNDALIRLMSSMRTVPGNLGETDVSKANGGRLTELWLHRHLELESVLGVVRLELASKHLNKRRLAHTVFSEKHNDL